jgi:hypothetical protein
MQTATIEVTYVGPPKEGKQYGFIKGADNSTFPVKADRIKEFQADNTYEVAYTEAPNGFKNIIGVKRIVPQTEQVNYTQRPNALINGAEFREPQRNGSTLMPAASAQPKTQAPQNGYYRPTAPKDSERMWTCAILGHYVDRGEVPLHKESVKAAINLLREAYQETYGQDDA